MTEINKPCYDLGLKNVSQCVEDGDRACPHLQSTFEGSWEQCTRGKLYMLPNQPPEDPPSEVQDMLINAGQWTERLLTLLERQVKASEVIAAAWVALRESEKKRVEYARNVETVRQHTVEKETEQWHARNTFLDANVAAHHRAWLEWNARSAEREEHKIAVLKEIAARLDEKQKPPKPFYMVPHIWCPTDDAMVPSHFCVSCERDCKKKGDSDAQET